MPFKPGVDEHDYIAGQRGGKVGCFPSKFQRGKILHHGYNTDTSGRWANNLLYIISGVLYRILPWWYNTHVPNAYESSHWTWKPVHPDLYVPPLPEMLESPAPPPVWETNEDILALVALLRSMGCELKTIDVQKKSSNTPASNIASATATTNMASTAAATNFASTTAATNMASKTAATNFASKTAVTNFSEDNRSFISEKYEQSEQSENNYQVEQKGSKVKKFSYTGGAQEAEAYSSQQVTKQSAWSKSTNVQKNWEEKLSKNVSGQQTNAADFTTQFLTEENSYTQSNSSQMYHKQENLSFPELAQMTTQPPPELPPKTKIKNSPSRNIFSPTEGLENAGGTGTASIKSVEFLPVKEKVKLIAAQQEELLRKEEKKSDNHKQRGVRILPPSPVTVRKMSVEEELHHYDSVVTRSTPTTGFMETPPPRPELPDMPMYQVGPRNVNPLIAIN